ncbi:MAG: homoserine dehydrogenase [Armatimonadetes bacterium]|nr:homoserine dehydrogenase [Armatimonadota bacterium]MDE2205045.1 homoserine dehydrogenase [Armatimonadota bacterium]
MTERTDPANRAAPPEHCGPIRIGFLGMGVVGTGVVELLLKQRETIQRKSGVQFEIARIAVSNPDKRRAAIVPQNIVTANVEEVIDDPAIHVVCELIGGIEPAATYLHRALAAGKHVVTANKQLLACAGHSLMEEAEAGALDFQFEASVCGGIPLIQPMKNALAANEIRLVAGIINGTTNYILSEMEAGHGDFETALRSAQDLGYAEANPESDIEGHDARFKIAILASIAFTGRINVAAVPVEGISHITPRDIKYARDLGFAIKLLGVARRVTNTDVEVRVNPALVRTDHPLAATHGVNNAVLLRGEPVGEVMFYGRGAGAGPTASAVVGDLMDVFRNIRHGATGRVPCTCALPLQQVHPDQAVTRHYLRMTLRDRPRTLAEVAGVLGEHQISIQSVLSLQPEEVSFGYNEVVWLTHLAPWGAVRSALATIELMNGVESIGASIRIEDLK